MADQDVVNESSLGRSEKRRFLVTRLREEGCEVQLQELNGSAVVSRVIVPHSRLSAEKQLKILQLVLSLAAVNDVRAFDREAASSIL
jgi:hypothetical protein